MFLYLACPIDQRRTEITEKEERMAQIVNYLRSRYNVFLPIQAFNYKTPSYNDATFIRRINESALTGSNAMVLIYDGDPAVGVWTELDLCWKLGRPVVAVTRREFLDKSVYMCTLLGHKGVQIIDIDQPLPSLFHFLDSAISNATGWYPSHIVTEDDGYAD